jgi:hypothetical protein
VYRAVAFDDLTVEDWNEPARSRPARRVAVHAGRRCRTCGGCAAGASSTSRTGLRPAGVHATTRYLPYYVAKRAGDGADRGAGARARRRSDPRQRDRAGADRGAGRHVRARVPSPSSARRRSAAGAARPRSRRPWPALIESDFITGETIRVDGGRTL